MPDFDSHDLERILRWGRDASVRASVEWNVRDEALYQQIRAMRQDAKTREREDEARQESQYGSEHE